MAVENHPGLERWVVRQAHERLAGPLASTLDVEDIDVLWLSRSVALRGVSMGPTAEEIRATEIVCRVGLDAERGLHVDRVTLRGGSVLITDALAAGFDGGEETPGDRGSAIDLVARSPEVVVRDLFIALELSGHRRVPVGHVDLSMTHGSAGASTSKIFGRLVPALFGVDGEEAGVVWLEGSLDSDHVIELRGVARSLRLGLDRASVEGTPLDPALPYAPTARVDLVADARFEVDRSLLPTMRATMAMSDGSLTLPWLTRAEERRVEGIELSLEIAYEPEPDAEPFDPNGWRAEGSLDLEWQGLMGRSGFRVGQAARPEHLLELWADLPDAPLGEELGELAAGERGIEEVEAMLRPRGRADVSLSVALPREREAGNIGHALERLILIQPRGEASLAYYGAFDRRRGVRDIGFPLPVRRVTGDVSWSVRPGELYPGQLAFYDARGEHARGPVDVRGSLHFVPLWNFERPELGALVPAPFHLVVSGDDLPLDEDFAKGMEGLAELPELRDFMPTWNPSGGAVDFRLELIRTLERPMLALDLEMALTDVDARWRELGVPLRKVNGRVHLQTAGDAPERGRNVTTLTLEAATDVSSEPVTVRGRIRGEGKQRGLSWFEIDARSVNPRSAALREELARKNPVTLDALDSVGAKGYMDLAISAATDVPLPEARLLRDAAPEEHAFAGGLRVWASATPEASGPSGALRRRVTIQPAEFPVTTRDVRGSLRVSAAFPPDPRAVAAERRVAELPPLELVTVGPREPAITVEARLQGLWLQAGPSVPLALAVSSRGDDGLRLTAYGAGLDIANDGLMGTVIDAARRAGQKKVGGSDPIDTDAIDLAGRIDFAARTTLPSTPGQPPIDTHVEVEARLDRLAIGGSQVLRDVAAHLEYVDTTGEWVGTEVSAKLGTTPVELTEVAWSPTDEGSVFRTRLSAKGLPIDEQHLDFFLDAATKRVVLEDLRARGTFDLANARLELRRGADGSTAVELDGALGVEDAFVDLGVPIELSRIEEVDLHLFHEGRGLRARAFVEGAFGAIAGRRLEDASLQLTYIEPRLVIEGFEGRFEGGRLRAIGESASAAANLFTIDLRAPFPFELSAAMRDIDIGEFLRGVFDSDFANRGLMDLDLRLGGNFEALTELEGGGAIRIAESALWAIPVFQALSTRLGIDTTVLFREMRCDYRIEDGAFIMERMRVDSDLLSLVGEGAITFEGDVTSDLEVRYALVDRLGPFTRLLYFVQNRLLRVTIRGTMERPTVILRGLISQFFAPSEDRDRLPLPGLAKRPARF